MANEFHWFRPYRIITTTTTSRCWFFSSSVFCSLHMMDTPCWRIWNRSTVFFAEQELFCICKTCINSKVSVFKRTRERNKNIKLAAHLTGSSQKCILYSFTPYYYFSCFIYLNLAKLFKDKNSFSLVSSYSHRNWNNNKQQNNKNIKDKYKKK